MAIPVARILEQRSFLVPDKLRITEHFFEVPRDYSSPSAGTLRLFARSARKHSTPVDPEDEQEATNKKKKDQLPYLLYLAGGPGSECPPPQHHPMTNTFLEKGYQLLYLDQRGTGLSSPISASTLGLRGDDAIQAKHLKHFRADNIVRDCEAVRQALTADCPESKRKWSVIGQSYGGFIITTYLSMFPHGLKEAFVTGGLPPLVTQPDEVYRRTFKKCIQRNEAYYAKYPEDIERVKTIVRFLQRFGDTTVRLPSEGLLTARRFLTLGLLFGFHNGLDNIHNIVLRAADELRTVGHFTRRTADTIDRSLPFDNALIYSLLHEPIYTQGQASNWSAQRILLTLPSYDLQKTLDDSSLPVYFTGEMIFPFMFDAYSELRKVKNVAHMLAAETDWPVLYDEKQLAENTVPVYAAVYMEDMYVDFEFSMETARKIKGCKTMVTNVMYHDAAGSKTEEVVKGLWDLRCDSID